MKPLVPVLVLALAVPAMAQETTATGDAATGKSAAAAAPAVKKAPPKELSTAGSESPLVAAANRNKNKKRDKKVITNETLKEMNQGRITTTDTQAELPMAPAETAGQKAAKAAKAQQDAKAAEEKTASDKKKADEQKALSQAQRAAVLEEELYLDADELPPAALQEGEAPQPAKP